MNASTRTENARMLAALLGVGEEAAAEKLNLALAVTAHADDLNANRVARHIVAMMSRTVEHVVPPSGNATCHGVKVELVLGRATPRTGALAVFVTVESDVVRVSRTRASAPNDEGDPHPFALLLGACYACAAALKAIVGDALPYPSPEEFTVDVNTLFDGGLPRPDDVIDFGVAHLAGAGAIGNGFVSGLSQFSVRGLLHVSDDDLVSDGNLQRCLHFEERDVDKPKVDVLCAVIERLLPAVKTKPFKGRLQNHPEKTPGPWLQRLIVGVDSPRARRELQSEIPGEVFDASTTGASEIVMHFHKEPTSHACLSCAYHESPEEEAHERHVADSLGVALADVRESRVSPQAAEKICRRYPRLTMEQVTGAPYDTLFKALCASGNLIGPEGKQVLTPFAFVSVLAGALLAAEFVVRVARGKQERFNEWRISPWTAPVLRRRRLQAKRPGCAFCSNSVLAKVASSIWQGEQAQKRATPGPAPDKQN